MPTKVALVTGASSGIGEATAVKLQKLGYTVYAAARRVERMKHLTTSGMHPLAMDVTNAAKSTRRSVAGIMPPSLLWKP